MTLSTTMADLLQLAEFESDMLTALAYENLGLDDLDEHVHINGELPVSMATQIDVIYALSFGRAQGRYLSLCCAEMVCSIQTLSVKLNQTLHKQISLDGHQGGRGDLEIARLESL